MVMPSNRKSVLEARYDKSWSSVGLEFKQLKQFIEAIKTGDLQRLIDILGEGSPFTVEQRKALLTRSFNENDFDNTPGTCIKNAETLAKKFENQEVLHYICQQKSRFCPSLSAMSIFALKEKPSDENDESPEIRPPSK